MFLLEIILFLFYENYKTPEINKYLIHCNYKEFIKELESNNYTESGYIWLLYNLYLKSGNFEKAEKLKNVSKAKKLFENKKYEVEILKIFFMEKDFLKAINYIRDYLKKEKEYKSYKRIGSQGWVAIMISAIIQDKKDLLEYFIKEKMQKGIFYAIAYYYLYKKKPSEIDSESFGHPDKKAYLSYMEGKITKNELIENLRTCYKDLPVWLEINTDLVNSLP